MIEYVFASGHVADLVLAVMVCEAMLLIGLAKRGTITLPVRTYVFGLVAGGCIILGLRQSMTGGAGWTIALFLGFSFMAHMAELFSLVRRNNSNPIHTGFSYEERSENRTTSKKGLSQ